ncbi:hypothetical protein EG349_18185 [Chryseobacterium shandongense]|uniref:Uncharacterized protein n=1 Tax=Chryseobacterium shandongense TaxID=1493872 RepID=A0AAD0YFN3_9FLAO|nr:hypothetical protein EG349_18185 [Chryseobacterium shandongense]AZA97102.1 hypothetical protein EG353_16890 [Chryseobacterium shandongense]OCK52050.1 hypothetical protein BA768_14065 [Chryseobacterium sp. CBo1]
MDIKLEKFVYTKTHLAIQRMQIFWSFKIRFIASIISSFALLLLLLRNYGSEAFDCERKIMIACKVRIYLSNCKSACNDFDLYLFYAG